MPLIYDKKLEHCNTRIVVWEATEPTSFFIEALQLSDDELDKLNGLKPHRKTEWLTSRYLCQVIDDNICRRLIVKDEHNKPSIQDSRKHISLSHSRNRAAVIISDVRVGIDIQRQEDKISRIQHKFISLEEHEHIDNDHIDDSYHIFWGAKECMYKAYGKRQIEFKEHMHLYPFKYYNPKLEIKGWLRKNNINQSYDIHTDKIDDYYLVFSILNNES